VKGELVQDTVAGGDRADEHAVTVGLSAGRPVRDNRAPCAEEIGHWNGANAEGIVTAREAHLAI
jgi:hypothetical protein